MRNKTYWVLILLISVLLFSCKLGGGADTVETITPETTTDSESEVIDDSGNGDELDTINTVESGVGQSFKSEKQTLGESISGTEYKLSSMTNISKDLFHRIQIKIEYTGNTKSTPAKLPQVSAEYNSSGAIRLVVNSLNTDNSGIGFQDSIDINKKGILKIYHAISGINGIAYYDIGVTKAPKFLLANDSSSSGNTWFVNLDIEYPGEVIAVPVLDLGSKTFSKIKQSINGSTSSEGASSTGYTFNADSGIFTLTFNISGSSTKPMPNCYAEYNSDGKLQLVFTDIADIFGSNKSFDFYAGGKARLIRDGTKSTYILDDIVGKEFKLSGMQNPNQIYLEVKL